MCTPPIIFYSISSASSSIVADLIPLDDGIELLIHFGIDTVNLDGKHFTAFVEQGQRVNQGDKLMEIDFKMIEEAGCPTATPVVLTSQNSFEIVSQGDVEINQPIIKLN